MPTTQQRITVQMSDGLRAIIRDQAARQGLSESTVCRILIQRGLGVDPQGRAVQP
jgi:hypothetical protein